MSLDEKPEIIFASKRKKIKIPQTQTHQKALGSCSPLMVCLPSGTRS